MPQWRVRDAMTIDVITDRGIVTRSDLLKVHARLDAVIRDEVLHQVLRRTHADDPPGVVEATGDAGVVTLAGHTARKTTAVAAARLTETVRASPMSSISSRSTSTTTSRPLPHVRRSSMIPCSAGGSALSRLVSRRGTGGPSHRPRRSDRDQIGGTAMIRQPTDPQPAPMPSHPQGEGPGTIADLSDRKPDVAGRTPTTTSVDSPATSSTNGPAVIPSQRPPANW
jgi:hypothetical protein